MSTATGSPPVARRPLGRRAFLSIVCIGLSALAWGGIARDTTKSVMPDSLLPWVLIGGAGADEAAAPVVPARTP